MSEEEPIYREPTLRRTGPGREFIERPEEEAWARTVVTAEGEEAEEIKREKRKRKERVEELREKERMVLEKAGNPPKAYRRTQKVNPDLLDEEAIQEFMLSANVVAQEFQQVIWRELERLGEGTRLGLDSLWRLYRIFTNSRRLLIEEVGDEGYRYLLKRFDAKVREILGEEFDSEVLVIRDSVLAEMIVDLSSQRATLSLDDINAARRRARARYRKGDIKPRGTTAEQLGAFERQLKSLEEALLRETREERVTEREVAERVMVRGEGEPQIRRLEPEENTAEGWARLVLEEIARLEETQTAFEEGRKADDYKAIQLAIRNIPDEIVEAGERLEVFGKLRDFRERLGMVLEARRILHSRTDEVIEADGSLLSLGALPQATKEQLPSLRFTNIRPIDFRVLIDHSKMLLPEISQERRELHLPVAKSLDVWKRFCDAGWQVSMDGIRKGVLKKYIVRRLEGLTDEEQIRIRANWAYQMKVILSSEIMEKWLRSKGEPMPPEEVARWEERIDGWAELSWDEAADLWGKLDELEEEEEPWLADAYDLYDALGISLPRAKLAEIEQLTPREEREVRLKWARKMRAAVPPPRTMTDRAEIGRWRGEFTRWSKIIPLDTPSYKETRTSSRKEVRLETAIGMIVGNEKAVRLARNILMCTLSFDLWDRTRAKLIGENEARDTCMYPSYKAGRFELFAGGSSLCLETAGAYWTWDEITDFKKGLGWVLGQVALTPEQIAEAEAIMAAIARNGERAVFDYGDGYYGGNAIGELVGDYWLSTTAEDHRTYKLRLVDFEFADMPFEALEEDSYRGYFGYGVNMAAVIADAMKKRAGGGRGDWQIEQVADAKFWEGQMRLLNRLLVFCPWVNWRKGPEVTGIMANLRRAFARGVIWSFSTQCVSPDKPFGVGLASSEEIRGHGVGFLGKGLSVLEAIESARFLPADQMAILRAETRGYNFVSHRPGAQKVA